MMDRKELLADLIDIAKNVAPLLGPGGQAAVAIAGKVVTMIDKTADDDDVEAIETRAALERRVNANVDATIDRLRG